MEELSFFLLVLLSLVYFLCSVRIVVPPFAGDLLQILNPKFHGLARVYRNSVKVQVVGGHVELGLRQIRNEVDHVGWAVLDIDRNQEMSSAEFLLLP